MIGKLKGLIDSYGEDYVVLDGVRGRGHYVGTYVAWGVNNSGWWGEGEIKFFMDGDEWPTICGTGTEDYFCGAYNFDAGTVDPAFPRAYIEFTTPYAGLPQVIRPDGTYQSQERFSGSEDDCHSGGSADQREYQAFREQLPYQPGSAGA